MKKNFRRISWSHWRCCGTLVTSKAKCALIHSFGMCAAETPPLHSGWAFAPLHHDDGPACPSTQPNRAPVGCAPGPCRPGPALKGALLPRAPQRQGFRAPTPTASVSTLDPDDGRACPSTQPRLCQTVGAHSNPARIGYAPGPFSPGPGLRRALPLRDLPRPGFRALTSTASVFPLAQDEQFYCSRAG